jgi:hypothetical protein
MTDREPRHPRGHIQLYIHHLDLTPDEPGLEDVILLRALFGATGWYHCLPPIHIQTLDAFTQDPSGTAPGWFSPTPSGDLITISHVLIGSARCVTYRSQRQRHLIFQCPVYYEIRGRYYCLYRDSGGSLSTFF